MENHWLEQAAQREAAGDAWKEHGLVFCNDIGQPLWRSGIRREWTKLLAKAGLPHMRVHDLRHTAPSLLLAEGMPVKVAGEMLGHSDVTTTLRIYAQVIEGAESRGQRDGQAIA